MAKQATLDAFLTAGEECEDHDSIDEDFLESDSDLHIMNDEGEGICNRYVLNNQHELVTS